MPSCKHISGHAGAEPRTTSRAESVAPGQGLSSLGSRRAVPGLSWAAASQAERQSQQPASSGCQGRAAHRAGPAAPCPPSGCRQKLLSRTGPATWCPEPFLQPCQAASTKDAGRVAPGGAVSSAAGRKRAPVPHALQELEAIWLPLPVAQRGQSWSSSQPATQAGIMESGNAWAWKGPCKVIELKAPPPSAVQREGCSQVRAVGTAGSSLAQPCSAAPGCCRGAQLEEGSSREGAGKEQGRSS